jgi:hypothetical protein
MRLIAVFVGITLMGAASAHAGCKIARIGSGGNMVLTGIISGFEAGPRPKKGQDAEIYLRDCDDLSIVWNGPYPKTCKVGGKITAKSTPYDENSMWFFANSITCK